MHKVFSRGSHHFSGGERYYWVLCAVFSHATNQKEVAERYYGVEVQRIVIPQMFDPS